MITNRILSVSLFFFLLISSTFASENTVEKESKENIEIVTPTEKSFLEKFNGTVAQAFFFDISFGAIKHKDSSGEIIYKSETDENGEVIKVAETVKIPFLVAFLALASIYLTFYFRLVNVRFFKHSFQVIRGKYDDPNSKGELSHFKALMSALSGTIGLGNIAGVAVAIGSGGPGALFWMVFLSFFGMTCKFLSTSLALNYRRRLGDEYSGGPMYFLKYGLKDIGLAKLGVVLGFVYAFFLVGGAFGAGNMFQANQAFGIVEDTFGLGNRGQNVFSVFFIIAIGLVIIGGVKRIGQWTSKVVPLMCIIYVLASLIVILVNITAIPAVFAEILKSAFTVNAAWGGIFGVLIAGFQRSAFSNEAGLGSASIVHANAKTDEPIREGIVAMIGPVIDTMIVCTATALVIVVTGAYKSDSVGIVMTSEAFSSVIPSFPYILTICVILFAYSTCITWFHYAKKGWFYLLEELKLNTNNKAFDVGFKLVFLFATYVGIHNSLKSVIDFSDLILLAMAFPNLIGCILLAKKIREQVAVYRKKLENGEFKIFK